MLPGPTFVKTFLRTYAEMLGLDPHVLVEEYRAGFEREDEIEAPLGPPAVAGRDRRHGPRIGPGLADPARAGGHRGGAGGDRAGERRRRRAGTRRRRPRPRRSETKPTPAPEPAPPRRVSLRVTPATPTYICVDRGVGHAGGVREHDRQRPDVPRQAPPREPRQARRAAQDERQAGGGHARPGSGRVRLHAAREPRAPGRRAPVREPCVVSGAVSARAGIVVTGTEVLTGRIQDRNGPWLSDRLLELGVELAHITICGDRPEDIEAQLRFLADQGVDLILTSGGLGPDGRRHDGRGGGPLLRARARARRRARGEDRGRS